MKKCIERFARCSAPHLILAGMTLTVSSVESKAFVSLFVCPPEGPLLGGYDGVSYALEYK